MAQGSFRPVSITGSSLNDAFSLCTTLTVGRRVVLCMSSFESCAAFVNVDDERANFRLIQCFPHRWHAGVGMAVADTAGNAGIVASITPFAVDQARSRASRHVWPVTPSAGVCVEFGDLPPLTGRILHAESE